MRKLLGFLGILVGLASFGQNCNNLGFETGDFAGWDAWKGKATGMVSPTVPDFNEWFIEPGVNPAFPNGYPGNGIQGVDPNQHRIVSAGTDIWSGIPMVSPTGGAFSAMLGDTGPGANAAMLRQTFLVTETNSSFVYQYAVVFEDPGHVGRPLFEVRIYDEDSTIIPCGEYLVRADQGIPGFIGGYVNNGGPNRYIVYKDWTDVAVDLRPYIGQSITIEYVTADCNAGEHMGYAYVDGYCQVLELDVVSKNCTNELDLTAPSGYQSYLWDNGMNGQSITANGAPGDSITVTMTPFMGCPTTLTHYFDSLVPLVADIDFPDACAGDVVQFTDESTPDTLATSWDWDFGDGATSSAQNPTHAYTDGGIYDVTLIVFTDAGCSDTIVKQIDICTITGAEFEYHNICENGMIQFTDVSKQDVDSIASWEWDFDGMATSTQQNPNYGFVQAGTYSITLVVTYFSGLTDTVKHSVVVHPNPYADFSSSSTCVGAMTDFTNQSTVSTGGVISYNWSFGSTLENPSVTFSDTGYFDVTLIVVSDSGCVDSIRKQVYVNPLPVVDFVGTPLVGCSPLNSDFTDLSTVVGGNIAAWEWTFGNGAVANQSADQNPSATFTAPGLYDVALQVTSDSGCVASAIFTDYVEVYDDPIADFSWNPTDLNEYNTTANFIDQSIDAVSWNWDFASQDSSTNQHPSYDFVEAGEYVVTLAVENEYGCTDTIAKTVIVEPVFALYLPNSFTPNGDGMNDFFYAQGINLLEFEMWIFNRWGEMIFTSEDIEYSWDGTYKGTPVQEGVYVWKVKAKDTLEKNHSLYGHVTVVR